MLDRLGSLFGMIGSRGLDQISLGLMSLLVAYRTGTTDFAPFATMFILYALAGQVADLGLGFAILRTPADHRLAASAWSQRVALGLAVAIAGCIVGVVIGGEAGVVIAFAGTTWLVGGIAYIGRAVLHWEGSTAQLARGEAGGAITFLAAVSILVHDLADLPLFAALLIGKQLVEILLQGLPRSVFADNGDAPVAGAVWLGQILTYLTANVDYLLVGTLLGPEALSVYAIAFRIAAAFSSIVATPLTRTAFVRFANATALQREHDGLRRQIVAFGIVGLIGTLAAAMTLPLILGPDWADTRPLTLLLGLVLPWRLLLGPVVGLATTTDQTASVPVWEAGRMTLLAGAILLWPDSTLTVAAAAGAATAVSISAAYVLACRGARLRWDPTVVGATAVVVSGLVIAGATL